MQEGRPRPQGRDHDPARRDRARAPADARRARAGRDRDPRARGRDPRPPRVGHDDRAAARGRHRRRDRRDPPSSSRSARTTSRRRRSGSAATTSASSWGCTRSASSSRRTRSSRSTDRASGRLMRIAVEEGKAANPSLHLGICGEHGGDPASVVFCHELGPRLRELLALPGGDRAARRRSGGRRHRGGRQQVAATGLVAVTPVTDTARSGRVASATPPTSPARRGGRSMGERERRRAPTAAHGCRGRGRRGPGRRGGCGDADGGRPAADGRRARGRSCSTWRRRWSMPGSIWS